MRKLWVLASKEAKLAFRDRGAIVTMLVTPLVLTLVIGAAFSGSGGAPIAGVPVLLLDQDGGVFSSDFIGFFGHENVRELVALDVVHDEAQARQRVEADEVAALIVIPEGFSAALFPLGAAVRERVGLDLLALRADTELAPAQQAAIAAVYLDLQEQVTPPVTVEIYTSPAWRLSGSIVKSIVYQAIETMNMQVQGTTVVMGRIISAQVAGVGVPAAPGEALAGRLGEGMVTGVATAGQLPIGLETVSRTGRSFDWLSYSAASMSILFLMFAVTSGGRTLLAERAYGTLPRLLVSPLSALTVLAGKMAGIVLTGFLQMLLLWGATSLLGAYWGPVPAVLISILALVLCASGVGALISAWSKTPGQAGTIGTAVTLVGSAISGTFFPRAGLPDFVQKVSLVTPNAWGIELFSRLQLGRGLSDLPPLLGGVLLLTGVYYALALFGFRRQFD
jgi:ABC-2 type transport system permease protein